MSFALATCTRYGESFIQSIAVERDWIEDSSRRTASKSPNVVRERLTTASRVGSDASMRAVALPTLVESEIKGMVDLQVDKFAPFPLEHMVVGLETLEQKEGSTRVLVAAAAT